MIDRQRIEELLIYSDGQFFWKKRVGKAGRRRSGRRAGYVSKSGYRIICLDYKDYCEHNLVWFIEHGEWPIELDHKDRNKANNHPDNLRLCTRSQNNANQKTRADNFSGHRGVYWDSKRQKWAVQVTAKGKTRSLGRYVDLEEAVVAAKSARQEIWGEFCADLN